MEVSDQILTLVLAYGAIVLGIAVFLAAVGLPFPSSVLVIACGAFVEQGFLEGTTTLSIALLFVVAGDVLSYSMGYLGRKASSRLTQSPTWLRAENYFKQRGNIAIFLTRCLFTPLAVPTNLIAGGSHFPFVKFASYATAGEFTWLVSYGSLGYLFGSQWEYISDFVSNMSGVLVGLAFLVGGIVWLKKKPQSRAKRTTPIGSAPISGQN